MRKIAENGDIQIFYRAFAVADGQRIQQSLRRMFMCAITRIDHRNIQAAGNVIRCAGCRMTHYQAIRLHLAFKLKSGVERAVFRLSFRLEASA